MSHRRVPWAVLDGRDPTEPCQQTQIAAVRGAVHLGDALLTDGSMGRGDALDGVYNGEIEHFRDEQRLRLNCSGHILSFEFFKQNAFVRYMLVNKQQPLIAHSHDETIAHLTERTNAERREFNVGA